MKELYRVKTKTWSEYYVFASSYDEAARKVEQKIIDESSGSVLTEDGSLKSGLGFDSIIGVEKIGDKLVK